MDDERQTFLFCGRGSGKTRAAYEVIAGEPLEWRYTADERGYGLEVWRSPRWRRRLIIAGLVVTGPLWVPLWIGWRAGLALRGAIDGLR